MILQTELDHNIAQNSVEYPILDHFPELMPLTGFSNSSAEINVGGCTYTSRSIEYSSGYIDKFLHLMIGLWYKDKPIGYFDVGLATEIPCFVLCALKSNDLKNDPAEFAEFIELAHLFLDDNFVMLACFIEEEYRGQEIGQTVLAIMLGLLQKKGYDKFEVYRDTTAIGTHITLAGEIVEKKSGRLYWDEETSSVSVGYSFYGRYGTAIDEDCEGYSTYLTALSTYQINLLQRATKLVDVH